RTSWTRSRGSRDGSPGGSPRGRAGAGRWCPVARACTCAARCAARSAPPASRWCSRSASASRAGRSWRCCATCPARWTSMRACCRAGWRIAFGRVERFVCGTRLSRVTEQLRAGVYREALECLARDVQDWSGGTRIGECIAAFEAGWPRLVDGRTAVIVLSDGWDTGEPEVLAGALARIRRRARRLIWLNPLLGSPGYQPLTRGMQAALPHVDVFAPAHDLESLARLARL